MEVTGLTRRVAVREQSDAGEARRQAVWAAESARFDDALSARLAIIVAEMTSNLLKHTAMGGEILINALTPSVGPGWSNCWRSTVGPVSRSSALH